MAAGSSFEFHSFIRSLSRLQAAKGAADRRLQRLGGRRVRSLGQGLKPRLGWSRPGSPRRLRSSRRPRHAPTRAAHVTARTAARGARSGERERGGGGRAGRSDSGCQAPRMRLRAARCPSWVSALGRARGPWLGSGRDRRRWAETRGAGQHPGAAATPSGASSDLGVQPPARAHTWTRPGSRSFAPCRARSRRPMVPRAGISRCTPQRHRRSPSFFRVAQFFGEGCVGACFGPAASGPRAALGSLQGA